MHATHVTVKIPNRTWTLISEWSCKYQVRSPQPVFVTSQETLPTGDPSELNGDPEASFEILPRLLVEYKKHGFENLYGWANSGQGFITIARAPNTSPGEIGEALNKFGINLDVSMATTPEDIWTQGGLYPYSEFVTAQSIELVSTSADDSAAGIGAQTVIVFGLDSAGFTDFQIVTMNGVTPVVLTGTWLAINRMIMLTSGSTGQNQGSVLAQLEGGGTVVSEIFPLAGQTQQCVVRTAVNQSLIVNAGNAFLRGTINGTIIVDGTNTAADCRTTRTRGSGVASLGSAAALSVLVGGARVDPLEWFSLRVISSTANNLQVAGSFSAVIFGE